MRALLLYVVLVGVPLVGLLLILRVGERLTPPRGIGGAWTVHVAEAGADTAPPPRSGEGGAACAPARALAAVQGLAISQSGMEAVVTLLDTAHVPRARATVRLAGDAAEGRGTTVADGACGAAPLRLALAFDGQPVPDALRLVVDDPACPGCAPLRLAGARVPPEPAR